MIVASIFLVIICALGGVVLFTSNDERTPVLAIARPVPYGKVLEAADLREVEWAKTDGLRTMPASQRSAVIGKRAASDLRPDTLVTPDMVTETPLLQPGQVTVGIPLTAEQFPVRPLTPGQVIRIVGTQAKNAELPETPPSVIEATVVEVGTRDERTGKTVVEVAVSQTDGPTLALRVYSERFALVVKQTPGAR